MRIIHSFSSINCELNKIPCFIFTYTLSAVYAKKSGFYIVLHTDKQGAYYLQHAPYDEIIVDLGTPPEDKRIYAWCKFEAMKNETEDAIHIDGDVFLKSPKLIEHFEYGDYDVLCQSIEEKNNMYHWSKEKYAWKDCKRFEWMDNDIKLMYNCGIIGFKNINIKKEYHNIYIKLMDEFAINGKSIMCTPELVSEQQSLYDLCKYKNYKVKCLLDGNITESATEIGYQHLLGDTKYKYFSLTKETLQKLDKNIFEKTEHFVSTIQKYIL